MRLDGPLGQREYINYIVTTASSGQYISCSLSDLITILTITEYLFGYHGN